ncbi:muts domain V-domain-containing protein [Gloeopeniophorella convolvens]|nr:muts domain V-domain-containing protein [Gloeopeniophorella convolvens]
MLVLTARSRNVVNSPPFYVPCSRLLSWTSHRSSYSQDTAFDGAPDSKPKVTKKKYAELPALNTLPDGPPAAPLDGSFASDISNEWRVRYTSVSELQAPKAQFLTPYWAALLQRTPPDTFLESTHPESPPGTRPRRARRVKNTEGSPNSDAPASREASNTIFELKATSVEPAPRRRRRRVGSTAQIDDPASQPRSQLATEILENLAKFPQCILLTRVGGFYESYFEQAAEVSSLLNIKLATRKWGGQMVFMCGFPTMYLQKYLKILVQQNNRFVAICEEFLRPMAPGTKPTFDRRVVRVVTPGTLIDEPFLNPYENNYLVAIDSDASPHTTSGDDVGLAWIDVSTGEFFTKRTTIEALYDDIVRIRPREVVLSHAMESTETHPVKAMLLQEGPVISYSIDAAPEGLHTPTQHIAMSDDVSAHVVQPIIPSLSSREDSAVRILTSYLRSRLLDYMPHLSAPSQEAAGGRMKIDAHTLKSLEIREGLQEGGVTGTLFSSVKRTVTSGGTRLLSRWLCSPSTSLHEINARQSLVAFFHARPHLRHDLRHSLRNVDDVTRTVQKFLSGYGHIRDLVTISASVSTWASIKDRILLEQKLQLKEGGGYSEQEWASLDALMARMEDLSDLAGRIQVSLNDALSQGPSDVLAGDPMVSQEPSTEDKLQLGYGWSISPGFSEELSSLHDKLQLLMKQREDLENSLKQEYSSPSLTLRSSPIHGLHVHVGKAKREAARIRASRNFTLLSESNSTCCVAFQPWTQLGSKLLEVSQKIALAEKAAFEVLRNEVKLHEYRLRRNARIVDELDVTLAFAGLASEMHFIKPVVTDNFSFHVINGRHPTVEVGLLSAGRVFTPNTVFLSEDSRLHIITGPNMAGKSTLLRQTALIAILAQAGSFVPADHAEIGIVDQLFSRVGAKDDLFRDRSTFMVEMLETSDILKKATQRSLVIMDEVGRGTSVKDGLAIAFAVLHHLYFKNASRALFATHFHELTDMLGCTPEHKGAGAYDKIAFFCTDVREPEPGVFSYSHRLRPGVNKESHGLKVAQLAGMPPSAIAIARETMSLLKKDFGIASLDDQALRVLGESFTTDQLDATYAMQ